MKKEEAKAILGNRANYEIKNIKKALSSFPILNTEDENKRLEACKVYLNN